jgi:uncharacterized protein YdbL (DUF1318 family)
MRKQWIKWLGAGLCGLLASCAVITVNVYFPEKDVKQAYKSLDEMLLKQGNETKPPEGQPVEPEEQKKEEVKPQSMLQGMHLRLSLVAVADAAENLADDLAVEMASMPEVINAYKEIRKLIPPMNALRESGAVGEDRQGLLKVLDKSKLAGQDALVKTMNDNRKIVITGMAKAMEKINKRRNPSAKSDFNQFMRSASGTFADTRREAAKPGWWIQQNDGKWVRK